MSGSRGVRLSRMVFAVGALTLVAVLLFEVLEPPPDERSPRLFGWEVSEPLVIESEIRNLELQFFDGDALWATRYKEIWVGDSQGQDWRYVGRVGPAGDGWWARVRSDIGSSRAARALRNAEGVETLVVLRSGTVVASMPPFIYRSEDRGRTWQRTARFRQHPEPKGILRHWGEDASGRLWFGEYGRGTGGADSRVFVSEDDGRTFDVAWTLPPRGRPGGVRHIHAVQIDPMRGRPWIATGDLDRDVRLGWLDFERRFRVVGEGESRFKAVSLMFTGSHVYWGTDSPRGPNGIWRWSRVDESVERVADLPGPVLFSTVLADDTLVVATEIEGVGSLDAQLWISRTGTEWEQVAQIPPFVGAARRRYGTASFPMGRPMQDLVFNVDRLGQIERSVLRAKLR